MRESATTSTGPARLGSDYWWMWSAAGLSSLADGVVTVALPLVAVGLTRSPTLIAGLAFAFTLPWLLFALPAGALVDRLDRRRAMLAANAARALLFAVLVLLTLLHTGSIWALYAAAFGAGTAETVYDTAAQSVLPQVVRRDLLPRANGHLFAVVLAGSEFVGPPLAGMLVAVGAALAFAAPTALWLVAAAALLLVRGSFRSVRGRRTTLRADIAEGLRFLWRQRILRTFTVMVGTFNLASNAAFAVLVLYAVGPSSAMGLSGRAFGLLLATVAAGSIAGSLVAQRIERLLGRARTLAVSYLVAALKLGLLAVTVNPYVVGAGFFVGGAGILVSNVITVSLRQRITPDRLLGRVNSSHRLVAYGTRPLGAALGGVLAQFLGLRAVFAVTGVLALCVLAGLAVVTDHAIETAEREAEAEAEPEPATA
jgi:MFS family permease